jgi:hypothetical protein
MDGYVVCQEGPAFEEVFSENFEKEKDCRMGGSLSFPFSCASFFYRRRRLVCKV